MPLWLQRPLGSNVGSKPRSPADQLLDSLIFFRKAGEPGRLRGFAASVDNLRLDCQSTFAHSRFGGQADVACQPWLAKRAKVGEPGGNRTPNPQIKSLLLCQLSYRPASTGLQTSAHERDR